MARVIDDALELCRAQTGKLRFQTERVDLSRIVMDAIRNAQPVLSQKDHQVTLTLPCGRIIVEAHPTRMEQILTNLLINAAKYTSPGGEICVGVERTANTVVLRVCDNGIGIAPEYLSRVFEPYWQGTASDGLGLGLALVKSLVELHDGTVVAHSDGPGKGSEFVVRLPAFRSCPNQPAIDMLRATVV
jgi:signal transduction histidine kinase